LLVQETNQRKTPPRFFSRDLATLAQPKQQTQPSASDSCFFFPRSLVKSLKIERGNNQELSIAKTPPNS